jgi:hypothetical protein
MDHPVRRGWEEDEIVAGREEERERRAAHNQAPFRRVIFGRGTDVARVRHEVFKRSERYGKVEMTGEAAIVARRFDERAA